MCDFRVGDEVVAIQTTCGIVKGETYTVAFVEVAASACTACGDDSGVGVELVETECRGHDLFCPVCEVKRPARPNILDWLTREVGIEDPKRIPAGVDA